MKIQTKLNSLVKGNLRFPGAVDITGVLGLHDSLIMIKFRLNNSISDCLGNNKLGILRTVQHEFLGNVSKGDLAVGERDGLDGRLDDVMMKSGDEGHGVVGRELVIEPLENVRESRQISRLDRLGHLKIKMCTINNNRN